MLRERLLDLSQIRGGPLLAFDTSTRVASLCSVAWQGTEIHEWSLPAHVMPSEALVEGLAQRSQAAKLNLGDLAGIIVGLGPGSFTGLRVGLATAKGLAVAGQTPLWGVSSLAALAAGSIARVGCDLCRCTSRRMVLRCL